MLLSYRRAICLLILPVSLLLVASPAAAGSCTGAFKFVMGGPQSVSGVAKKDQPCTFGYDMTDMVSAKPAARPSHGQLLKKSLGNFAYVPKPGFVGQDSFAMSIAWGTRTHTIQYNINVVP